jgi:hypothetical protein
MTTTPSEDIAALFDLPLLPESSPSAESTTEAAEAALAAELASTIESGGVAADAPDSRTDLRVEVSWPARMQLANGDVIELEVRNISAAGVGLTSDERIPARTVVKFEMEVPPLVESGQATPVEGTIRTTYTVAQGSETLFGGTWVQVPPAGLALVNRWVERLRR